MREQLHQTLKDLIQSLLDEAGDAGPVPDFALETPRNEDHGDFACNAAMLLAKRLKQPPRAIAERLIERIGQLDGPIQKAEVAGPGFVNLWLSEQRWHSLLRDVLAAGARYGHADWGAGKRVQVEFVSANPTGPLTLGHGRQAVLGDAIARLLEATGHDVTREYYFNNGGRQMRVLGQSVKARYLEQLGKAAPPSAEAMADPEKAWLEEVDGLPVVFPHDGYQGAYIGELAAGLVSAHGDALVDEEPEAVFRETAETQIFAEIRKTLGDLAIHFDVYSNERDLYEGGDLERALTDLEAAGLLFDEDGARWLRATSKGLERDRVLVRRTGEPTYLLPDIAYHRQKFARGFDAVIDVQGADHKEQFPYVVAGAEALGCDPDRIELVMNQFVTLTRGGEQVKQSTRKATYITVDELLEQVGADVFRFFMVQRRAESHLDFDLDLAEDTDWKKNPTYTLQYAHARTHAIERKARELGVALPDAESVDATPLVLPEELEILKKISEFPEVVSQAAKTREPHHLCYYGRDLAGLWNPYQQDGVRHRVLSDDPALTNARLGLALAVRTTLSGVLSLLGISTPERM
ncbi:MAG: arginine--tRNA ligase [Myxococcota bacterium]